MQLEVLQHWIRLGWFGSGQIPQLKLGRVQYEPRDSGARDEGLGIGMRVASVTKSAGEKEHICWSSLMFGFPPTWGHNPHYLTLVAVWTLAGLSPWKDRCRQVRVCDLG